MSGQVCTNSSADPATSAGGDDRDDPGPSRARDDEADQDNPPERTGPARPAAPAAIHVRSARVSREDVTWLEAHLSKIASHLPTPIRRANIAIVDDVAMTALHDRHLGIAATTDVLTFAVNTPDEPIDADIAVCADEAGRQAASRGHDLRRELLLYMLHGLLHCSGHDDRDEAAWAAMHAEEDRILEAIGLGRVFASGPGEGQNAPGHDGARTTGGRDRGTNA